MRPYGLGGWSLIGESDELAVAWLPVERLVVDDQALDVAQVAFYRELMRPGGHVAPPVVERAGERFRVRDGRHRIVAHVELGRPVVRCVVVVPAVAA